MTFPVPMPVIVLTQTLSDTTRAEQTPRLLLVGVATIDPFRSRSGS